MNPTFFSLLRPDTTLTIGIACVIWGAFFVALFILAIRIGLTWKEAQDVPKDDTLPTSALVQPDEKLSATQFRLLSLGGYQGRSEAVDANEAAGALQERGFEISLSWVRYFVSALLFLGLMGTVVGLASTIGHLSPVLQSGQVQKVGDLKKIVQAIGEVVKTMQNAFACTLLGILTSLLCSLGAQLALWQYQQFVLRPLDKYCSRRLVPFLSRSPEYDRFVQAASDLRATVVRAGEVINQQQSLQKVFSDRLAALITQLEAAGEGASKNLIKAGQTVTDAGVATGQQLIQAGRSVTRDLHEAGQAVSGSLVDASNKTSQALTKAGTELAVQMDRTTNWLSEIGPTMEESLAQLTDTQTKVGDVVGQMLDSLTILKQQLADAQHLTGQSVNGLKQVHLQGEEYARTSSDRLAKLFEEHLNKIEAFDEQRQALATILKDVAARQEALVTTISDYGRLSQRGLEAMVKTQENHAGVVQKNSADQLKALQSQTRDLASAIHALQSLIDSAEYAFRDAVSILGPQNVANGSAARPSGIRSDEVQV